MPWPRFAMVPMPGRGSVPRSPLWVRSQFRRVDDGAGGRLQTWRRGVKFWMRCWWRAEALAVSTTALRDGQLGRIAEQRPELALRPLRSYLRRGLDAGQRAEAVRAHFEWMARRLPATMIEQLYAGVALPLLVPASAPVEGLGLTLTIASGLGREGELALHLEWQGQRAMSLAFSVLDASRVLDAGEAAPGRGDRLVVGTLQGARGADDALRALGAASQRLRPSALLVLAVQALGAAWRLEAPLGVAAGSHVYAGYTSRRRAVGLDYDAAWRDAGGVPAGAHYWHLPAEPVLRSDAEVESRRRAQHRRRNALRVALLDQIRRGALELTG